MWKFRSIASQLCAAFPYYCLRFSTGSAAGFHTIIITELYKKDAEIKMTVDQLSWFASLGIVNTVSAVINGFLAQRLGSRILGFITSLLMIISWLLYFYSTNTSLIFISRVLITIPATNILSGPYISEISEPSLRGPLLTIDYLVINIGAFFSLLLGSLINWRTVALVNFAFPLIAAVLILLVTPDSPTRLINEGRLDEAKKALCWLRGWVKPVDVQTEFYTCIENLQIHSKSSLNETITRQQRLHRFFTNFHQRSFYLPLGITCIIYVLHSFSGVQSIANYTGVILQELNSPIEVSVATAITGGMSVTGAVAALFFTSRTGKRKLVFLSVFVAILCHGSIAIRGFLKLQGNYLWITPIAIFIASFVNSLGIGTSVHVIISEIFPSPVRYIGTSIGNSVETIMGTIVKKLILYIIAGITTSGLFFIFVCVNIVAFVTYYFVFPETEGRTLKEIEDHYKGVQDLKECK